MSLERHEHPLVRVDGHVERGRNYDVEIAMPDDNRDSIYGVLRDLDKEPIRDAVVKLVEIRDGERRPVSHTFTNEAGEFVFGPLCRDRQYEVLFWASKVRHVKICKEIGHQGGCLTGVRLDCDRPRPPRPRPRPCAEGSNCEDIEE